MNIKKIILFFLLFSALPRTGMCQMGDNSYPVFDQFFKSFYLVNPAIYDTTEYIGFSAGNRTLTGLFEGVTRFYGNGSILLSNKERNNYHLAGVQVITAKDGDFFSRDRVYFRYAYLTKLGKNVSASLGATAGLINYSIKASQASAGGNALSPDGALGLIIQIYRLQLGVSCQQIFQPKLQPVGQLFTLPRYFNYTLNYSTSMKHAFGFKTFLYVSKQSYLPAVVQIAPLVVWKNLLEAGINYKYERGIAVVAGISSYKIYKGKLRFMGSYFVNTSNLSGVNDNVVEFSLGYAFTK